MAKKATTPVAGEAPAEETPVVETPIVETPVEETVPTLLSEKDMERLKLRRMNKAKNAAAEAERLAAAAKTTKKQPYTGYGSRDFFNPIKK